MCVCRLVAPPSSLSFRVKCILPIHGNMAVLLLLAISIEHPQAARSLSPYIYMKYVCGVLENRRLLLVALTAFSATTSI